MQRQQCPVCISRVHIVRVGCKDKPSALQYVNKTGCVHDKSLNPKVTRALEQKSFTGNPCKISTGLKSLFMPRLAFIVKLRSHQWFFFLDVLTAKHARTQERTTVQKLKDVLKGNVFLSDLKQKLNFEFEQQRSLLP